MLAAFRWCCLLTLLFGTLVAGVKPKVAGKARTYITNDSSQTIVAVVSFAYFPEPVPVPVKNRVLPPGAHGVEKYHSPFFLAGEARPVVQVEIGLPGGRGHKRVTLDPDISIVVKDSSSGAVDIYRAQYRTLKVPDGAKLATVDA